MNSQTDNSLPGLADYLGMIWRRRHVALLGGALAACLTLVAFNFVPRRYTARAEFERNGDFVSTNTQKMPANFNTLKSMLAHDLTSPTAVRQAMLDLDCDSSFDMDSRGQLTPEASAQFDRLVEATARGVRMIWVVKGPDLDRVAVHVDSRDPILAWQLPNKLVDNYITMTRRRLLSQLEEGIDFLDRRIAEARQSVADLQQQRYNFLQGHPDMLPENPEFLANRLAENQSQIERLRRERLEIDDRIELLSQTPQQPARRPNPTYAQARQELKALEQEHQQVVGQLRMTEKHPRVAKLSAMIEQARQKLDATPMELTSEDTTAIASRTAKMEQLTRHRERLDEAVAEAEARQQQYQTAQANFLPVAKEYNRLSDLIEQGEREVAMWQSDYASVRMALEGERNGTRTALKMVKPAAAVYRPSWPALWHVFALAIGGGVSIGALAAVVSCRLSRCFSSSQDVQQQMGLPVLGTIGPILSPAGRRLRNLRRYVLMPAAVGLLLIVMTVAAAGIIMSTRYPTRYSRFMDSLSPTARETVQSIRSLLGTL